MCHAVVSCSRCGETSYLGCLVPTKSGFPIGAEESQGRKKKEYLHGVEAVRSLDMVTWT